ncbi:hypothetical protein K1719_028215 [Acacia pycnantha]|nr:hypothetical protein K1719_028215 [Acacia pycnantha]
MGQIENNGAAPYLPEEIITNILSRLMAKSLIRFQLWNPLTRDVREVPESRSSNVQPCLLGFGFSPIVNDYKIVAVYRKNDGRICGSDVYSLSRNSWKEIEFGSLDDVTCSDSTVSVNGVIFACGDLPSPTVADLRTRPVSNGYY